MTVVYINAVQYQTCPNHESDNHFFAKIPGGVRTPGPPLWIRPCFTKWQNFGRDQIESIYRRQIKCC